MNKSDSEKNMNENTFFQIKTHILISRRLTWLVKFLAGGGGGWSIHIRAG